MKTKTNRRRLRRLRRAQVPEKTAEQALSVQQRPLFDRVFYLLKIAVKVLLLFFDNSG